MADIKLKIVTPERVLYEDTVDQLSVSTTTGQLTILPHHLPLVSQLAPGELIIKKGNKVEDLMAISGGLLEVLPDQVVVLADTAERASEIDEQRAEAARIRAQELLQTKVMDAEQFAYFSAALEKELARLRVAKKYKHTRGADVSLDRESES
ncbi:MAG: ATP synthase F1 subunit epsilon [Patescibacteria group bacterium]